MPVSVASWAPPRRSPTIWPPMTRLRVGEVMPRHPDPGPSLGPQETAPEAGSVSAAVADPDVALMLRLQAGDEAAFQDLCLNEVRRPERHLRVDIWDRRDGEERAEGPPLPDPSAVTPEEGAAARQLGQRLEVLVAELPPKQRAALLLSRMDGLAYRDVAEALGSTEGAVKALLFRATQTLKRGLREYL